MLMAWSMGTFVNKLTTSKLNIKSFGFISGSLIISTKCVKFFTYDFVLPEIEEIILTINFARL